MWQTVDPMGRDWWRSVTREKQADCVYAWFLLWQGTLEKEQLAKAECLAKADKKLGSVRELHGLRGAWQLEQREWAAAAASFHEAVRMARERRLFDGESEAGLVLSKFHLDQLGSPNEARQEAERLGPLRYPPHRYLAMLWLAIGDLGQAKHHALAAYRWAWADGEPYVNRYELTKTTELLQQMAVAIPQLPPYDPAKEKPFPWEAGVRAAIENIRARNEAK